MLLDIWKQAVIAFCSSKKKFLFLTNIHSKGILLYFIVISASGSIILVNTVVPSIDTCQYCKKATLLITGLQLPSNLFHLSIRTFALPFHFIPEMSASLKVHKVQLVLLYMLIIIKYVLIDRTKSNCVV